MGRGTRVLRIGRVAALATLVAATSLAWVAGTATPAAAEVPGTAPTRILAGALTNVGASSAVTSDGTNLYVADAKRGRIWKVDASGAVSEVARGLLQPGGITTDGTYLYVANTGAHEIVSVDIATGQQGNLAGRFGIPGSVNDPVGSSDNARFASPRGVALVGGDLYVADTGNHTIRKVEILSPSSSRTTLAAGVPGVPGDVEGPTGALFRSPEGLAADGTDLYVADTGNHTIRRFVPSTGTVTTLAGSPQQAEDADGTASAARFDTPRGVAVLGGAVYVADEGNQLIRKLVLADGTVTTVAGLSGQPGEEDGVGPGARFRAPAGLAVQGTDLYVAQAEASGIREVAVATGTVTTIASTVVAGAVDGPGAAARFDSPHGAVVVGDSVYVTDTGNHTIRKVAVATGAVTTFAGTAGTSGGADGTGAAARFHAPRGLATDGTHLYVADTGNHTIRKVVVATGAVTTVAGTAGSAGAADGTGAAARFRDPSGVATDGTDVYVSDTGNTTVRRVALATGAVTTLAGTAGSPGLANGTGAAARFQAPHGIAAVGAFLYVADRDAHNLRRIELATGAVTGFAGSASGAAGNEDGTGGFADFNGPVGLTTDGTDLYVTDTGSADNGTGTDSGSGTDNYEGLIRRVGIASAAVTTLSGRRGHSGVSPVRPTPNPLEDTYIETTGAIAADADGSHLFAVVDSGVVVVGATPAPPAQTQPVVSVSNGLATEGTGATANMAFTVSLDRPAPVAGSVRFKTFAETAIGFTDFAFTDQVVSFGVGDTSKVVNISVEGDTDLELTEGFRVVLYDPVELVLGRASATGTIVDDEAVRSISIDDVTVTEFDTDITAVVPIRLSGPAVERVEVDWAYAGGTASLVQNPAFPSDLVGAASGTASFEVGQTEFPVYFTVRGETKSEPDETLRITLSNPDFPYPIADGEGILTILNDDTLTASVASTSRTEGNSGTADLAFTVSLNGPAPAPASVTFATSDGTAIAPEDYTSVSQTVEFATGESSKVVNVPIVGDTVPEDLETFTVTLSNPSGVTLGTATATGTIGNDDRPTATIADASRVEGNSGTADLTFTITLDRPHGVETDVFVTAQDGTASRPADYSGISTTVVFAAGETSKTVAVPIVGDLVEEDDETFTVTLVDGDADFVLGDPTATGTILDDDRPSSITPTVSIADATVTETDLGNPTTPYTVTLAEPATGPASVQLTSSNGTAVAPNDYFARNLTVSFVAGESSKTVSLPIVGDTVPELEETFTLTLSDPVGLVLGNATATVTIIDNDTPRARIASASVVEGDSGTTDLTFTVTLGQAGVMPASVRVKTNGGDATPSTDYIAVDTVVHFAAGDTSETVVVPINGDTLPENDEIFVLFLSEPSALVIDGSGQAIGTITNDDHPTVSITGGTVTEGDSGMIALRFTLTLDHPAPFATSVRTTTADGTATNPDDYGAVSQLMTFSPGSTTRTVDIGVNGDTLAEGDETFTMTLSEPNGVTLGTASATGTITDDDGPARGSGSFDGDGRADVFWYGPGEGADTVGYANEARGSFQFKSKPVTGTYVPLSGDFDGDGYADVFWYGPGTDPDSIWFGTATRGSWVTKKVTVHGTYDPVVGDFDGDGHDDVFWYGPGAAADSIAFGTATRGTFTFKNVTVGGTYTPVAGDFDGDGRTDVFWYGPGADPDTIGYANATRGSFTFKTKAVHGTYTPVAGDFDADGYTDVFWYGPGADPDSIWYGTATRGGFAYKNVIVAGHYQPVTGDFDGDGHTDIFWYGPGPATDSIAYPTTTRGTFTFKNVTVNGTYTPIASG